MKSKFLILLIAFGMLFSLVNVTNAASVAEATKGKILLQVEENGEAWYVNPLNLKRYYLGRPADAFDVMRELGLGISEVTYNSWNGYSPAKFSGRIVLRVEENGEAYYINPANNQLLYLGRPADAWQLMRNYGLGITTANLETITMSTSGADLNVDLTEVCPTDMKRYTNSANKYTFCYDKNGAVKTAGDGSITFTRDKDISYDGLGQVIDFYESIDEHNTNLLGLVSKENASTNSEGTYVEMVKQNFDDGIVYYVVAQNQINKKLVVLSYQQADGNDKFFMDGLWNTFEFTESEANAGDKWKTATSLTTCPTNSNLKLFKRQYQYQNIQFCYDPSWPITLADGGKVKITPPVQGNRHVQGNFTIDLWYEKIQSFYNSEIVNSDYVGINTFTTDNGNPGLDFTATAPGESPYKYINVHNQNDTTEGPRATFFFSGDAADYDFSDFKQNIIDTLKFLPQL